MTSCSRCVEKHGIHVKSIRNPSSVLIFLLELLIVHYLQHLVKYLKTMCQSSPPHAHLALLLLYELLQEGAAEIGETFHSVQYSNIQYTVVECIISRHYYEIQYSYRVFYSIQYSTDTVHTEFETLAGATSLRNILEV